MFDNIGQKIKKLATVICWIGIVFSVMIGLTFMRASILTGFTIAALGALSSWIGSLFTYGYGQLIENTDILVQKKRANEKKKRDSITKTKYELIDDNIQEYEYIDMLCPHCSKRLSFTKSDYINNEFLTCPYCDNEIETEIFFK